jgi:hypothetical protein
MRLMVTIKAVTTPFELGILQRVRHLAAFIGAAARRYRARRDEGRGDLRCSKYDRAPMTVIATSPIAVTGIVARVLACLLTHTRARKTTCEIKIRG